MPESILKTPKGKIAVATTVMLTFISFWRAAAIVLNDMGSSDYYVAGIAEVPDTWPANCPPMTPSC